MVRQLPKFDDLPGHGDFPCGCAWGLFDSSDGTKDRLGTLNLLTTETTKAAVAETSAGISVSLNWRLDVPAAFNRQELKHDHLPHTFQDENGDPRLGGWDDVMCLNTQSSSQWDSLCHFLHQSTSQSYNGAKFSVEDGNRRGKEGNEKYPTLEHWHGKGGMVARGVLLDFRAYAEAKGISYSPFERRPISIKELEDIAAFQNVELKPADVLIIRTGFTEDLDGLGHDEFHAKIDTYNYIGLEGSADMARWIWNNRFAAVAGDQIALEVVPPAKPDGSFAGIEGLILHPYMLSMFGMPIGELWWLKDLATQCHRLKKYSFMLTSVPLNAPGTVGSPPNALAIL